MNQTFTLVELWADSPMPLVCVFFFAVFLCCRVCNSSCLLFLSFFLSLDSFFLSFSFLFGRKAEATTRTSFGEKEGSDQPLEEYPTHGTFRVEFCLQASGKVKMVPVPQLQ